MTQRLPDPEDHRSDWDSSNQDGTSGCDSPPAYESLEIMASAATPTPQNFTSGPKGNDRAPVQRALLYTWSNCEIGQGWGALVLEMALNAKHHSGYSDLPGAAGLMVKCRDVPRLMREGFFWSAENILPEEDYMSHSTTPGWSDIGFHHKRVWSLADKSNGDTPLWVAQLEVRSHSVTILSGFQVHNLSRKNVHRANAWNEESYLVYHFESQSPRDSTTASTTKCLYRAGGRGQNRGRARLVAMRTFQARRWNRKMGAMDVPLRHFLPVNMSAPSLIKSPAAASCCSCRNCVVGL
jgi:hypothetical protein